MKGDSSSEPRKKSWRMVIEGEDPFLRIACPACGCNSVHLSRAVVSQRDTYVDHHSNKVVVESAASIPGNESRRGSTIAIVIFCEEGHETLYDFTFHKGSVRLKMYGRDLSDYNNPEDGFVFPVEMWRD